MFSIGLTGSIGAGKTFVADIMKTNHNFKIYNSDLCAKKIINNDKSVIDSIKSNFGNQSYINGKFNTKLISKIVFENELELKKLNNIVHPRVFEDFKTYKLKHSNKIIVVESALLFETGMYKSNDYNILIICPDRIKIERVLKRDKSSRENILKILNTQWNDSKKAGLADFVMENINKLDTEKKVLTREINKKLSSYKQQDIKNEIYSEYHIIKYPDVIQLLLESKMKCKYCRENVFLLYKEVRDPKQWTLDRIDNNFGHNNDNVIICCLDCNLKRRNTNMNKFLFTKQLKISKV